MENDNKKIGYYFIRREHKNTDNVIDYHYDHQKWKENDYKYINKLTVMNNTFDIWKNSTSFCKCNENKGEIKFIR